MGTETDKTEELISSLRKEEQKCLRTFTTQEASGRTVKVSKFEGLNLSEYKLAKAENCGQYHEVCRSGCSEMVHAADAILSEQCIPLPQLWRRCFPLIPYDCEKAQRRLLQMPVVCIRFNNGVVVAEKKDNNYYDDVVSKVNEMGKMATVNKGNPLTRNDCQDPLKSTTSTSEVQRIKHVISSTHNLSDKQSGLVSGILGRELSKWKMLLKL